MELGSRAGDGTVAIYGFRLGEASGENAKGKDRVGLHVNQWNTKRLAHIGLRRCERYAIEQENTL